jgi:hypothetical protein
MEIVITYIAIDPEELCGTVGVVEGRLIAVYFRKEEKCCAATGQDSRLAQR